MKLKETLENLQAQNKSVKVGGSCAYHYCGEINEDTFNVLNQYLDRDTIETYPSFLEDNTTIVIFEGNEEDHNGRYWTTEEYNKKHHK